MCEHRIRYLPSQQCDDILRQSPVPRSHLDYMHSVLSGQRALPAMGSCMLTTVLGEAPVLPGRASADALLLSVAPCRPSLNVSSDSPAKATDQQYNYQLLNVDNAGVLTWILVRGMPSASRECGYMYGLRHGQTPYKSYRRILGLELLHRKPESHVQESCL